MCSARFDDSPMKLFDLEIVWFIQTLSVKPDWVFKDFELKKRTKRFEATVETIGFGA